MTRTPSNRVGLLMSARWPSVRTAVLAALPGHAEGLGDARHRQMMNDHARQRPAHRYTRELGTRIGRLAHILTPHLSTLRALVAARAHRHDRGAPPAGLARQASDHRVTRDALAPAALAPPILTSDTASQYCMIRLNALPRHLQPQEPSRRVNAITSGRSKTVLDMSRSFRWTVSEPPSSEDLDPYPATIRPTPPTAPTPSDTKSRFDAL